MATDLRDRLHDLADRTPRTPPPADLWSRGVRRRRAGRVGTSVLVAALVLILGVGAWSWRAPRQDVTPVAPRGTPHLPDRFYSPSPWLHTFDGPPGDLVTVIPAEQKTMLHTRPGLVGVTAAEGTYGFLHLPADAALDSTGTSAFALAPDGGNLAFWLTGTPTGSPNTVIEGMTITGVGTYDTVTGRARTYSIPTVHGVSPSLLMWADNDTLSFAYSQIKGGDDSSDDSGTAHYAGRGVWEAVDARPTMVPGGERLPFLDNLSARAAGGSLLAPATRRDVWALVPAAHASPQTNFRVRPSTELLVPNSRLTRVVAVPTGSGTGTGPLAVAVLPRSGSGSGSDVSLRTVQQAGDTWFRPLAWVDAHHVAALRRVVVHPADGNDHVVGEIDLVDIRSGSFTRLVSEFGSGGSNGSDTWLATDLLGAPTAHATPPPDPWDRRAIAIGLIIAAALLGGIVLVERRSRGRRA
jgi:hypothetical protein